MYSLIHKLYNANCHNTRSGKKMSRMGIFRMISKMNQNDPIHRSLFSIVTNHYISQPGMNSCSEKLNQVFPHQNVVICNVNQIIHVNTITSTCLKQYSDITMVSQASKADQADQVETCKTPLKVNTQVSNDHFSPSNESLKVIEHANKSRSSNTKLKAMNVKSINYHLEQSILEDISKVEQDCKNRNIVTTYIESSTILTPFKNLSRLEKKNLLKHVPGWNMRQLQRCYNYRFDKQKQSIVLQDREQEEMVNGETTVGLSQEDKCKLIDNRNNSIQGFNLFDETISVKRIHPHIKQILQNYLQSKKEFSDGKQYNLEKQFISSSDLPEMDGTNFPSRTNNQKKLNWHRKRMEKLDLVRRTGLTLKQINDQLRLLRDSSPEGPISKEQRNFTIQFLKVRNFGTISESEKYELQQKTGLSKRQIVRLVERIQRSRLRIPITKEMKKQVEDFLSRINYSAPTKVQRLILQHETGLDTKQLNDLILRIRHRYNSNTNQGSTTNESSF